MSLLLLQALFPPEFQIPDVLAISRIFLLQWSFWLFPTSLSIYSNFFIGTFSLKHIFYIIHLKLQREIESWGVAWGVA
jgi:hypothetical protein